MFIDFFTLNKFDAKKTVLFVEVKRNPEKIAMEILKSKSEKLAQQFNNYKMEYKGYSLNDIKYRD